jgi:lysophospholipase L1-like esterase
MLKKIKLLLCVSVIVLAPAVVRAELPWQFTNHTRYMALGDSIAAGYGAIPATQGYVYLLYQDGVIDTVPNTLFCNAAVPGATSKDVLDYQAPQVALFHPNVITLTVGGNDLFAIMGGADSEQVLNTFAMNLQKILYKLRTELPDARIYVSNQYSVPEIAGSDQIVPVFNTIVAQVAQAFGVTVVDVYSAFEGRSGLLLIERHDAAPDQAHPTNAGYRAMANAFEAAVRQ